MTPHIAVVAPVRGRPILLHAMLDSLWATVSDPSAVEVLLRVDDDDQALLTTLCQRGGMRLAVGPRLGYARIATGINECARLATAPLVLVVNDDAVFDTPNWDTRLVERAAQYPDGIFVLGVDTTNAKNFIFPCVSRRQIDLFGGVFNEAVVYPDILLRDILHPFRRAIRVPEVTIRHDWQGRSPDQEAARTIAQGSAHHDRYRQGLTDGIATVLTELPMVLA